MRRTLLCLLIPTAVMTSGCLLSPFTQRLRSTGTQVSHLEQRVDRLENASSGALSSTLRRQGGLSSGFERDPRVIVSPGLGSRLDPLERGRALSLGEEGTSGAPVVTGAGAAGDQRRLPWLTDARVWGKLIRGLTNLLTGWVEVPKRVHETYHQYGLGVGWTWGVIRGMGHGLVRTVGGAYEIVTFPVPTPSGYRPVLNPPYVFTDQTRTVYDPTPWR